MLDPKVADIMRKIMKMFNAEREMREIKRALQ
jgi:hypothetical protein